MNRVAHEDRRVVDRRPIHSLWEARLELVHLRSHGARERERVGSGRLEHDDGDRRLVVEHRTQREVAGTELDAREVAKSRDLAVVAGLHDDVAELRFVDEAAACANGQLIRLWVGHWRRADDASRHLQVLLADRVDDVSRREVARGHLVRVEPHAHGVVARAEHGDLPGPRNARQLVPDVEQSVVPEVHGVVAPVRRHEVYDHRDVGRPLLGRDA